MEFFHFMQGFLSSGTLGFHCTKNNLNDLLNNQSKTESVRSESFTREIPLENIIPSSKNQYGIREIEELAASIELAGLLHNLVVREIGGGKYELVSGERRYHALKLLNYKTAPCKVEQQSDDLLSELKLIMANSTARELSDYEKTYQAARLKELLLELKKSGYNIPGRLRDKIADIMNVSPTQVAIMDSINKHLTPELKEEFKDGKIGISAAYELSKLAPEKQVEVHQEKRVVGTTAIKNATKKTDKQSKNKAKTSADNKYNFLSGGNLQRFTVLKNNDIKKYLDAEDAKDLVRIIGKINNGRIRDGKKASNLYLVINTDEPYAQEITEILKRHGHLG